MNITSRFTGAVLLVAVVVGCNKPQPVAPAGADPEQIEAEVREKFKELQAAAKARSADKMWALLSKNSRADAENEARKIRSAYEKGSAEEKVALAKELDLEGAKVAKLTGKDFLTTHRFLRKSDELADSTLTKVTADKETATAYWTEEDGDKEKTIFVREDGQWKAWLGMPKKKAR